MLQMNRRSLITGLSAFIAAPAIIKVASLMPVKVWQEPKPKVAVWVYETDFGQYVIADGGAAAIMAREELVQAIYDITPEYLLYPSAPLPSALA
jgi:hypothetical protein